MRLADVERGMITTEEECNHLRKKVSFWSAYIGIIRLSKSSKISLTLIYKSDSCDCKTQQNSTCIKTLFSLTRTLCVVYVDAQGDTIRDRRQGCGDPYCQQHLLTRSVSVLLTNMSVDLLFSTLSRALFRVANLWVRYSRYRMCNPSSYDNFLQCSQKSLK